MKGEQKMNEYVEFKTEIMPFEGYGKVKIYFTNTEDFTLISIPNWGFSFLWNLKDADTIEDDNENKNELIKVLSVPMGESDAIKLSQIIFQYLWNGKWEK